MPLHTIWLESNGELFFKGYTHLLPQTGSTMVLDYEDCKVVRIEKKFMTTSIFVVKA